VRDDQRQGILMRRLHVDEVDLLSVDLGVELRQRVQLRLAPPPVVFGRPVAGECLDRRELHALRAIVDQLLGGQPGRGDAATQVFEGLARELSFKGTNR
jgi:hypothetical protein